VFSEQQERAIDACYAAVATPELWPEALDELASSLGATAAMFYPKDFNQDLIRIPSSTRNNRLLEEYVGGQWYENDYRAMRGWPLLSKQKVIIEHDLATDDERRKLPDYNDLYLKWGLPGYAAVGFMVDGAPWCLPILRAEKEGFFTKEEAGFLSTLSPHLRRMVKLSSQFGLSRSRSSLEAFDRTGQAAVLIGPNRQVGQMNAKAEALLERNTEALFVRKGYLCAYHPRSNNALQVLIASATSRRLSNAESPEALPVYITRPDRHPIVVEAASLPSLVRTMSSTAQAVLLLTDPEDRGKPKLDHLAAGFGLTPAEVKLCKELESGASLFEAADALGIVRETARHRLKSIFAKTDTHRQSELMLLLSRLS
jgi:DNA-binding CsgD family transcriptional regulator